MTQLKFASLFFVSLFIVPPYVFAQEKETVYETVIEDVIFNSSSRTIIDEKTIRESRSPDLTTLISGAANLSITSTAFQPNSIFVRGGDAAHVLIVVDGIPFYDASTSQRTLNLNTLDIKSIRRIEIIKGSQTVLYGGQALSAVIKIETVPRDLESKTGVQAVAGTFDYRDLSFAHFEPIGDDQGVVARGRGTWKEKQSPVLSSDRTYLSSTTSGELSYLKKGQTEFILKTQYLQDFSEGATSSMAGTIVDVDDYTAFTRQVAGSGIVRFRGLPWTPRFSFGVQNSVREWKWPVNPSNFYNRQILEHYGANLHTLRLEATPLDKETHRVLVGASYIFEDFLYRDNGVEKSNNFNEQKGAFATYQWAPTSNFNAVTGFRVEQWRDKTPVESAQLGLTYKKTKFEISSDYKTPSPFQLFSSYGNRNLNAERAKQASLTQDFSISDKQEISLTGFFVEYDDLIITVGSGMNRTYQNVSKVTTSGAELMYTARYDTGTLVQLALGYQDPWDEDNKQRLVRRPLYNGSLRITQNFEPVTAFVELIGAGDRLDYANMSRTRTESLDPYHIVNAAVSYKWDQSLNFFLRGNNVFNNRYEETYTYYVEGFSLHGGVEAWF
ncbi:MAG: TonB-dependent receptor plug domain-containing protein [Bdellovibrionia bacterium]